MSLFVFFISLLIVAQHVSGNHVSIIRSWRLRDIIASCWYVPWLQGGCQDRLAGSGSMDALPANRTWQSTRSHGTYQHEAITSHSRQLLMMGTWLPETCWATNRRKTKNTKVTSSWFFLSTLRHMYVHIHIVLVPLWGFLVTYHVRIPTWTSDVILFPLFFARSMQCLNIGWKRYFLVQYNP